MSIRRENGQVGSDALIRQVDNRLATLLAAVGPQDAQLAGRLADTLRELVAQTSGASASDRARVRAAVHYFVLRRDARAPRQVARSLSDGVRVVNRTARDLGRDDLVIAYDGLVADVA